MLLRTRPLTDMLLASVLKNLFRESLLQAPDVESFKRQELIFVVLNLSVLSILLLIHTLFSTFFGRPPRLLVVVLSAGFLLNVIELIWVQGAKSLTAANILGWTWFTIGLNMTMAFTLASLSYRQDTQYFALLVAPILQAAFRFTAIATISVVAACAALNFFWVWNYFRIHPPFELNEYMEAATFSLFYAIVGILVWNLMNQLRAKERALATSLAELEEAKERLLIEERLAAVGRFSSAIAHEIRNPVAMISSALSTAFGEGLDSAERQEMFEIAAKEASRLERLTSDFLAYARPRSLAKVSSDTAELVHYVADVCRPRASEKQVIIDVHAPDGLMASIDSGQVQQALLNLAMNAIDASRPGGVVLLRGMREASQIRIEIENANGPIPSDVVTQIFEPFFTTKAAGTGLGLAIARKIANSHGGELVLSRNEGEAVQFAFTIPAQSGELEH